MPSQRLSLSVSMHVSTSSQMLSLSTSAPQSQTLSSLASIQLLSLPQAPVEEFLG